MSNIFLLFVYFFFPTRLSRCSFRFDYTTRDNHNRHPVIRPTATILQRGRCERFENAAKSPAPAPVLQHTPLPSVYPHDDPTA